MKRRSLRHLRRSFIRHFDGQKMTVYTIGFAKKSAEQFFEALRQASVERVCDVRLRPSSQLSGFAKQKDLAYFLEKLCNVEYLHIPALAPTSEMLDGYKKKRGSWAHYEASFLELMRQRKVERLISAELLENSCLLCSEHSPEFCHRRLVVDYLNSTWTTRLAVIHL